MKTAAIGLIICGLVSLVLSAIWPSIAPVTPPMDESLQNQIFEEKGGGIHGSRNVELSAETQAKIDEHRASAKRSEAVADNGGIVFKIGGTLCTMVGVGLFFWIAQTHD